MRNVKRMVVSVITAGSLLFASGCSRAYVHPGMLHTKADLDRMKTKVAAHESPWTEGWGKLQDNKLASASYIPSFAQSVYRNDSVNKDQGNAALHDGAMAAYYNALDWYITGNKANAEKAIQILNGWSSTIKEIKGHDDILAAGLYGYILLNAAEIIRYSNAGWSQADIGRFTTMMNSVFYPVVHNFGLIKGKWANGNWDQAAILFIMCLGVWNNDTDMFDKGINFFKSGPGNGSIEHYIQTDDGQTQESGRDQAHAQLGLSLLSMAAEVGYNQRNVNANGADLYAYPNNSFKLLKGIEYTAKYNLGYDVSWKTLPDVNREIRYERKVSSVSRGEFRPMYEQVYNFYKNKLHVPDADLTYTKQVIDAVKLEDYHADHPSYGSLLFAQDQRSAPLKPVAALIPRNLNNVYISAQNSGAGPLAANQVRFAANGSFNIGDEQSFEIEYLGNKTYTIKSQANGKYVSVSSDGSVSLNADSAGTGLEQKFQITQTGNNVAAIKAMGNNKFVTVDPSTKLMTAGASSVTGDDGRFIFIYRPKR